MTESRLYPRAYFSLLSKILNRRHLLARLGRGRRWLGLANVASRLRRRGGRFRLAGRRLLGRLSGRLWGGDRGPLSRDRDGCAACDGWGVNDRRRRRVDVG